MLFFSERNQRIEYVGYYFLVGTKKVCVLTHTHDLELHFGCFGRKAQTLKEQWRRKGLVGLSWARSESKKKRFSPSNQSFTRTSQIFQQWLISCDKYQLWLCFTGVVLLKVEQDKQGQSCVCDVLYLKADL